MLSKLNKPSNEAASKATQLADARRPAANPTLSLVDNRPEAVAQKKLLAAISSSPRSIQMKTIQEWANRHAPKPAVANSTSPVQRVVNDLAGNAMGLPAVLAATAAYAGNAGYMNAINLAMSPAQNMTINDLLDFLAALGALGQGGGGGPNNSPDDGGQGGGGAVGGGGVAGGGVAAAAAAA